MVPPIAILFVRRPLLPQRQHQRPCIVGIIPVMISQQRMRIRVVWPAMTYPIAVRFARHQRQHQQKRRSLPAGRIIEELMCVVPAPSHIQRVRTLRHAAMAVEVAGIILPHRP
jgi:hypothetical protein